MGCRQKEQRPEENEIYIYFHKMEKETEFNYTIEDYDKNYEQIAQLSKNIFKKLEKKQTVRIGFVNEIMRMLSKLNINERENRITRKILFYTLVLTLTLKNFLKENENNSYIKANNDLQQSLLTMAIQTLESNFENMQNLKVIIYYIAKMLVLLFKEMTDIDQYINIEKYIKKLNSITEKENLLEEKEVYPFIKVNLSCLGEYFVNKYEENNLKLSSINTLIDYFILMIFSKTPFISQNYAIYKKEIFSENYLFNIIGSKRKRYCDPGKRKRTLASIAIIDNIIDINNKIFPNLQNNNAEVNEPEDELTKLRKDQNYIDLIEINDSFYYFFKSVIHDMIGGKNIFDTYNTHINDFILKKSNDMRFNAILPGFNKASEILLILFFVKCKINNDNVIIYSFLQYISDNMEILINNKENKDLFFNIIIIFLELFRDDENINEKNIYLLSKIFIIENEELKEDEEFLIERILNFSEIFDLHDSRLGLFISFLAKLNYILKENQNDTLIKDSLEKINEIFEKLNNMGNEGKKGIEDIISLNSDLKNKTAKFILNKEEFSIILKFCDFGFLNKQKKGDYIKKNKNELFDTYLNFFINFIIFVDCNFYFNEIYNDISSRNLLFQKIISIITKLEIICIKDNDIYINELLVLIKKLINIIKKNTFNCFVDFEIIYKYLNHNLYKISKIETEDINFINFKLVYSISIFIITQLKKIFRIPSSMQKLHNEIVNEICKENKAYQKYLNNINIGDSSNKKDTNNFYFNLLKEFSDNSDDNSDEQDDIFLTNKEFKNLIDILHNKFFGKNSPLIIYFQSQGNILNENETGNAKYQKYKNENKTRKEEKNENLEKNYDFEEFDNIIIDEERNANDTVVITVNESNSVIDMSLRDKKNKSDDEEEESESESVSKYSDYSSQYINIPENDNEEILNLDRRKSLDNSIRDDMSYFKL